MSRGRWIQTYNRGQFFPMNPQPEDVLITDVAHALAMQCRYNGHTDRFYSVAQHSVMVSDVCDPADALWGLLHDASEAYTGDMVSPLKFYMKDFQRVERRVMRSVCEKFGLPLEQPDSVTHADQVLCVTEKRDLMGPSPAPWNYDNIRPLDMVIEPLDPAEAEKMFLARFRELTK